ncbi:acyltransferase family protein [Carnimonas nigrificans]|uniref:acyltransferase family protein n=1 Tax=Carnimonas nigrificans TaxID=64323 RepID=UPI00046ED4BF|nr:acyltransferase [Carnimonas nigrificans]
MLISVQALRAAAAWLVVFHHFMQVFFDFHAHTVTGHLLSTRGQVGVDVFFIVSGFVIYLSSANKRPNSSRFILERVVRIAPAYWLFTLLTAAIIYYNASVMPPYGLDASSLLKSLLFIPTQNPAHFGYYPILPVGWTLNFEMMFYLLFALSLLVGKKYRGFVTAGLVIAISCWAAQTSWISTFYAQPVIYEFLLGIALAFAFQRNWLPALHGKWLLLPFAIAAASIATILCFDDQNPYRLFTWGIPAVLLVASFITMEPLFKHQRWLKHLGDWSYSVYLVHIIILWGAADLLHEKLGFTPHQTLLVCLPIIMLLSWGSFTLIEIRFSRLLKQLLGLSSSRKSASSSSNKVLNAEKTA